MVVLGLAVIAGVFVIAMGRMVGCCVGLLVGILVITRLGWLDGALVVSVIGMTGIVVGDATGIVTFMLGDAGMGLLIIGVVAIAAPLPPRPPPITAASASCRIRGLRRCWGMRTWSWVAY